MSWLASNWNARPPLGPFTGRASKKLLKCHKKNNQQYQETGGFFQVLQVFLQIIYQNLIHYFCLFFFFPAYHSFSWLFSSLCLFSSLWLHSFQSMNSNRCFSTTNRDTVTTTTLTKKSRTTESQKSEFDNDSNISLLSDMMGGLTACRKTQRQYSVKMTVLQISENLTTPFAYENTNTNQKKMFQ